MRIFFIAFLLAVFRVTFCANGSTSIVSIQQVPFIAMINATFDGEVKYFNGIIIDVNLVLTLGYYCRYGRLETFQVRVGSTWRDGGTVFTVSKTILHPNPKVEYDFCLLLLSSRITFKANVQRAILPLQGEPFPQRGDLLYFASCGMNKHGEFPMLARYRHFPVYYFNAYTAKMGYTAQPKFGSTSTYGDAGAGVFKWDTMVIHALNANELAGNQKSKYDLFHQEFGTFETMRIAHIRNWLEEERLIYS